MEYPEFVIGRTEFMYGNFDGATNGMCHSGTFCNIRGMIDASDIRSGAVVPQVGDTVVLSRSGDGQVNSIGHVIAIYEMDNHPGRIYRGDVGRITVADVREMWQRDGDANYFRRKQTERVRLG